MQLFVGSGILATCCRWFFFLRIISHVQSCESPVGVVPGRQALILWLCPNGSSRMVDSASSNTIVSNITQIMSKYKYYTMKPQMAHYIT